MPCTTWLTEQEARDWAVVADDKECDELLQQLRKVSGRNWVIGRAKMESYVGLLGLLFRQRLKVRTFWTLYLDCHGEWQIMNLMTPKGGSLFHLSNQSREDVMNYMVGYIGGSTASTDKREG